MAIFVHLAIPLVLGKTLFYFSLSFADPQCLHLDSYLFLG
jgi:hypothetical protein